MAINKRQLNNKFSEFIEYLRENNDRLGVVDLVLKKTVGLLFTMEYTLFRIL